MEPHILGLADEFLKAKPKVVLKCSYKSRASSVFCAESNNSTKQWQRVERWFFKNYKKHRKGFKSFNEFVDWYTRRPCGSVDLDAPEQAVLVEIKAFCIRDTVV